MTFSRWMKLGAMSASLAVLPLQGAQAFSSHWRPAGNAMMKQTQVNKAVRQTIDHRFRPVAAPARYRVAEPRGILPRNVAVPQPRMPVNPQPPQRTTPAFARQFAWRPAAQKWITKTDQAQQARSQGFVPASYQWRQPTAPVQPQYAPPVMAKPAMPTPYQWRPAQPVAPLAPAQPLAPKAIAQQAQPQGMWRPVAPPPPVQPPAPVQPYAVAHSTQATGYGYRPYGGYRMPAVMAPRPYAHPAYPAAMPMPYYPAPMGAFPVPRAPALPHAMHNPYLWAPAFVHNPYRPMGYRYQPWAPAAPAQASRLPMPRLPGESTAMVCANCGN